MEITVCTRTCLAVTGDVVLVSVVIIALTLSCAPCVHIEHITRRSSATREIVRDADDVDFSGEDVHSALTLARRSQIDGTDEP